jgi:hypothetical protein
MTLASIVGTMNDLGHYPFNLDNRPSKVASG